jgi:FKBP-type peptidyl-prolyl cis-trans isomerase FkpA
MKNKIFFIGILFSLFSISGCLKDYEACKNRPVSDEEPEMIAYATAQGMNTIRDASGLYYQITNFGSGQTATGTSIVSVKYTGKLLNGTVFDNQTTPVDIEMSRVIAAWRIGLPLIQEGGVIRMIVPSSLGYGCNGLGSVPGNSILYFQVEVVDVK